VEGWAYLRVGELGKSNELASSYAAKYAVTRNEFKEPTSPLPTNADVFMGYWGHLNPRIIYGLSRGYPSGWDYTVKDSPGK
jgi:hypothetical protein